MAYHNTFSYPYTREYYGKYAGPYHTQAEREDDEVLQDVEDRLADNGWVDESSVKVKVLEGRVTLMGTVDTIQAKRSAGDDAWDIPGVVDVVNKLKIVARGGDRSEKKAGEGDFELGKQKG